MAATTPPVTTADVLAAHERLTRYLHSHFRRRLTLEEVGDAAAVALAEADRAVERGDRIEHLDRWLKRAAWRNALDAIRKNVGEGKEPRPLMRPLDTDHHGALVTDSEHEELVDADAHAADARALVHAFEALKPDEQRALRLRYFDELGVDEVMEVLGCSRHRYENLVKRGLRGLREALVETAHDAGCQACRALTLQANDGPLLPLAAAERDAHLAGCLACRAFARRQKGLIAALPLPALGVIERIQSWLGARFASPAELAHSGEAAAGTTALAAGATGAGTTAAGGVLSVAGAAKTLAVVCSATAVTAGVCVTAAPIAKPDRPAKAKAEKERSKPKARAAAPAAAAPAIASAPHQAPVTTTAANAPKKQEPQRDKPDRQAQAAAAQRESSPFLPEGGSAPETGSGAEPTAYQAGARAEPAEPPTTPKDPKPASADFSQEFTP